MDNLSLTRHERRRLQTRKLLIETTLQLIFERGYDAVSVQDITDQADLGRGTFYIHFKDKEEIVWVAIRDSIREMEQAAHKQFEKGLPPQAEYYGLLNIFLHAEKNRKLYSLMFGGKGAAVLTARVHDLLADLFLHDIRNAPAPPDIDFHLPEVIEAQMLTGIITRLIYWWLEKPNDYSAEQIAAITYMALYRKSPPAAP
jgi:AcrR family transcriptional regulator